MLTMFLEEKMAGDTLCEKRRVFAEGSRLETGVRGLAVWMTGCMSRLRR